MTRLFSYDDAVKEYGIPRETLVKAVASGQLPAIKFGPNFVRLREVALDRWLEGQERIQ